MADAVDTAALADLQESVGDRDVAVDIVRTYLVDIQGAVVTLAELAASGDANGVRRAAHTVKPGSRLMGAARLADLFSRIEAIGASGTVDGAPKLIAEADAQVVLVTKALESWIAGP